MAFRWLKDRLFRPDESDAPLLPHATPNYGAMHPHPAKGRIDLDGAHGVTMNVPDLEANQLKPSHNGTGPRPRHWWELWKIKLDIDLKNATIGLSDGLTVPFALTAGLSALDDTHIILYAGLAELVAGAISMGFGGYLGQNSELQVIPSPEGRRREKTSANIETDSSIMR